MALRIYLVRHGKTPWNLARRLQGSTDIPLAQEGIDGAKAVGKALKNIEFTACYSSMLKRTHQTAQHILGDKKVPHFHHQGLNELDFGLWEGVDQNELMNNEQFQMMISNAKYYTAQENQGETLDHFRERIMTAFNDIIAIHKGQNTNILIAAHGMVLTLLTAIVRGLPWYEFRNKELHNFVLNTTINIIEVKDDYCELIAINKEPNIIE